jgi:hypothetical protein
MKKTKFIYLVLIAFSVNLAVGQELKKEYQKGIIYFIDCIKNNKKEAVAKIVKYPLNREYPIPAIKTKTEFVKRYDQVFDSALKNKIINSNPAKDWSQVGWRGIMLNQGDIWIDEDGFLTAVNYQSKYEKNLKTKLISSDKSKLHSSIAKFKAPVCVLETSKFKIRIDDLGNDSYRYASWSPNQKMTEKPDLIITNGKFFADGSGGNHYYDFKKGNFLYRCYIIVLGESDSPDATLEVLQNGKEIVSQEAKIISK